MAQITQLPETKFLLTGFAVKLSVSYFAYRNPIIFNNTNIPSSDIAVYNGIGGFCFPVYWSITKFALHLSKENPLEKDIKCSRIPLEKDMQCKIISSTQVEPEYIPYI